MADQLQQQEDNAQQSTTSSSLERREDSDLDSPASDGKRLSELLGSFYVSQPGPLVSTQSAASGKFGKSFSMGKNLQLTPLHSGQAGQSSDYLPSLPAMLYCFNCPTAAGLSPAPVTETFRQVYGDNMSARQLRELVEVKKRELLDKYYSTPYQSMSASPVKSPTTASSSASATMKHSGSRSGSVSQRQASVSSSEDGKSSVKRQQKSKVKPDLGTHNEIDEDANEETLVKRRSSVMSTDSIMLALYSPEQNQAEVSSKPDLSAASTGKAGAGSNAGNGAISNSSETDGKHESLDDILDSYQNENTQTAVDGFGVSSMATSTASPKEIKTISNRKTYNIHDFISALISDDSYDTDFIKTALLGYRKFFTPREVLLGLISQFDQHHGRSGKDRIHIVQLRVITVLNMWLQRFYDSDFHPDLTNGRTVQSVDWPARHIRTGAMQENESCGCLFNLVLFLESLLSKGEYYKSMCQKFVEILWNRGAETLRLAQLLNVDMYPKNVINSQYLTDEELFNHGSFSALSPSRPAVSLQKKYMKRDFKYSWPQFPPNMPPEVAKNLINWFLLSPNSVALSFLEIRTVVYLNNGISPFRLAESLTQMIMEPFMRIDDREFLHYIWLKDRRTRLASNVLSAVVLSKMVCQWVQCVILSIGDLKLRALCVAKFIETAWICYNDFHNNDSASAIMRALNSAQIRRLRNSFVFAQQKLDKHMNTNPAEILESSTWQHFDKLQQTFSADNERTKYLTRKSSNNSVNSASSAAKETESKSSRSPLAFALRKGLESLQKSWRNSQASIVSQKQKDKGLGGDASYNGSLTGSMHDIQDGEYGKLHIPNIQLVLEDLSKLDVTQTDFKGKQLDAATIANTSGLVSPDGKSINWTKFANMHDFVEEIELYQAHNLIYLASHPQFMEPKQMKISVEGRSLSLRSWIACQNYVSPDDMMARSLELEIDEVFMNSKSSTH